MKDLKSIPSHSSSVVARKTGSEYILVPLTDNIADMNSVYTLNETGAFLWENIDGKRTIDELISLLVSDYDTTRDQAEKDVMGFIEDMGNYLIISYST